MPDASVERITTHAAIVFLVGELRLPDEDAPSAPVSSTSPQSSVGKRALESELELNRRTAPMLYLRLVPVAQGGRDEGRWRWPAPVNPWNGCWRWCVSTRRRGSIGSHNAASSSPAIVDELAAEIAAFKITGGCASRTWRPCRDAGGDRRQCGRLAGLPETILPSDQRARLTDRCRDGLARRRELLEERRRVRAACAAATAICTSATSSCSRAVRCCSTVWSWTNHWRRPTRSTILRSCSWTCSTTRASGCAPSAC